MTLTVNGARRQEAGFGEDMVFAPAKILSFMSQGMFFWVEFSGVFYSSLPLFFFVFGVYLTTGLVWRGFIQECVSWRKREPS